MHVNLRVIISLRILFVEWRNLLLQQNEKGNRQRGSRRGQRQKVKLNKFSFSAQSVEALSKINAESRMAPNWGENEVVKAWFYRPALFQIFFVD